MLNDETLPSALEIAVAVRSGSLSARQVVGEALVRIATLNPELTAVTNVLKERALREAKAVDEQVARGEDPGPLAGVPYAVKDLFDVAGLATTAGSATRLSAEPATDDALAIKRLRGAGAVLVATLNMDEFAYGFLTNNHHWGTTRNPHDKDRFAGGSSGGSAAAVAAGMVAFSLGSDTNGSIRIPASLCGVYGMKPSHGRLPPEGTYPFVESLDDIGPFARSAADLSLVCKILGAERNSPTETPSRFRVARLGGWFEAGLAPQVREAFDSLAGTIADQANVEWPQVAAARAAAYLITAHEGSTLHRQALADNAMGFDPATRDRFLSGLLLPDAAYEEALTFRRAYQQQIDSLFDRYDLLLAPTTHGPAPRIDEPTITIDGVTKPAGAVMGLFTQPVSFVDLPVVAAPLKGLDLPVGVQLIGRRGEDETVLAFAKMLEERGLIGAQPFSRELVES